MVFGTGEFPRNYLDPAFFAREAGQLKLPPEVEATVEHLVTQLQNDMEARAADLISLLKKGEGLSDRQVTQTIQTAQKTADARFDHFLSQTKQVLLNQLGGQHAQAIDKFVADMKEEIAPRLDLTEKVRQEPTLKDKAPPKSIFELPAKASKKRVIKTAPPSRVSSSDPYQQFYNTVQQWQAAYSPDSPQYKFADAILTQIKAFIGSGKTIDDLIAAIQQNVYSPASTNNDIYMRFLNLTQDQVASLAALITGSGKTLNTPTFTQMDTIYTNAANWNNTKMPGRDSLLVGYLVVTLQRYGSSDDNLDAFRQWAQSIEGGPDYQQADAATQTKFQIMAGIATDPMQTFLDKVQQWQAGFAKDSPQYKFADAIIQQIKSLMGQGKSTADLIAAIQQFVYSPAGTNNDIYMRFCNLTQDQVASLAALITGDGKTLNTPIFTQMDHIYTDAENWINTKMPPNDALLVDYLVATLQRYGSSDDNLDAFRQWARTTEGGPDYAQADAATQTKFQAITGVAIDPMQTFLDKVQQWQAGFAKDSPQYKFADAIIQQIKSLMGQGKSTADLIAAIQQFVYSPAGTNNDIFMRFFGLTHDQAASLATLITGDGKTLNTPTFTQMDSIYTQAVNWNNTKMPGNDSYLVYQLVQALLQFGSSDDNLDALRQWARGEESGPAYGQADAATQLKFQEITGIAPPDPMQSYLDKIEQWQAQYQPNSPQYKLAAAIIVQIKDMLGQNKTLADLIKAIQQNVYSDPSGHGDDIYMQFFGVTAPQMGSLAALLSDGHISLQPPDFTTMDTDYKAVEDWLAQANLSPNDKKLAQALLNELATLGSNNNQVDPLKTWAQAYTSDPTFTNASDAAQKLFCKITGATQPPPTPTGLAAWEQEIAQYLGQRTADFAQLLLELGIPPNPMPKTPAQWNALAGFANSLSKDIERATQAGTQEAWSKLAHEWGLPDGDIATIQKEAQSRLKGYTDASQGPGDQSAIKLFTEVLNEIKSLEKSGGSVADLAKWAKGMNLANFPGLSAADTTEFNKLLSA